MIFHADLTKIKLRQLIERGDITIGGNRKLKIYGLLTCGSGKRMKRENRVFFRDKNEAVASGFRPCKNCRPGRLPFDKLMAGEKPQAPASKFKVIIHKRSIDCR